MGFDGVSDIDIWFLRFIVAVTGPFHDDVGSDAHGEGIDDEGAATGMGAGEFPLRLK